ncbi:hypothetical protein GF323_06575 [Candidatus Woesearchaeota archaeon]|nr:hypothetical protein [Candidatus Woesearchaeota archaeon]
MSESRADLEQRLSTEESFQKLCSTLAVNRAEAIIRGQIKHSSNIITLVKQKFSHNHPVFLRKYDDNGFMSTYRLNPYWQNNTKVQEMLRDSGIFEIEKARIEAALEGKGYEAIVSMLQANSMVESFNKTLQRRIDAPAIEMQYSTETGILEHYRIPKKYQRMMDKMGVGPIHMNPK